MPDSFPFPPWGQQSFDERDLDSLLAGTPDFPLALRPVADSLNALRAAPSPRELQGEPAVRAQFRALNRSAEARAHDPRTLEMPISAGLPPHRGTRRARRPARGWSAPLAASIAAAAIIILAAVTYTGNLPGPVQRIAHDTIAAPSARQVTNGATGGVEANSAHPAPSGTRQAPPAGPESSQPAPNRTALCNAFWSAWRTRQLQQGGWQTSPGDQSRYDKAYDQLSDAAGGPQHIYTYCLPVWQHQQEQPGQQDQQDPQLNPQLQEPHHYPQQPSYPLYPPYPYNRQGSQTPNSSDSSDSTPSQAQPQNSGQSQSAGAGDISAGVP